MRKGFKLYATIWALMFGIFLAGILLVPNKIGEYDKFGGAFWAGYIGICVAFVGQFICSLLAFKEDNSQKFFYKLPLITIGYSGLIVTLVVGIVCILVPDLPNWLGAIICGLILVLYAIAVVKAGTAANIVSDIDDKIEKQTSFIKSLTVDAEGLVARATTESIKAECTKVYEAVRYSDPMSNDALASTESEITIKFAKLAEAVKASDEENVKSLAEEVVILVGDRNRKCKMLK